MQIWKLSAVPIIKITVSQLQTHPPLPCFVILKMDPVDSFPCQELQVETLPIEAAGGTLEGQSRRQGPPSLVCVLFFHVDSQQTGVWGERSSHPSGFHRSAVLPPASFFTTTRLHVCSSQVMSYREA